MGTTGYYCPVCKTLKQLASLGPYTITLECGVKVFKGKPDPNSDMEDMAWYNFDGHTS